MKLILKREELKNNILKNCSILDKKDIISNSLDSIICLIFFEKKLTMLSYNNDIVIKTIMDIAETEEKVKVTVNGISLKNVVNSFNCENITIEIDEETLIFKEGKQKYKLSCRTDVHFPDVDAGKIEFAKEIDEIYFKYILDKTLFCIGSEKENPILNYVWFDEKIILSGNGHRFTKIKNKIKEISNVAISSAALFELDSLIGYKGENKLYYYTDGAAVFFIIDNNYFLSCILPSGKYPTYLNDSINVQDKKIIMNTNVFLDGIKFITNTINDANHKLFLELIDNTLAVYTETDIFDGYNEIPVIAQKNTEFQKLQVCINYKYLLDIVSKIKETKDKIMIEYKDNSDPINIRAEEEPFIHSIATIEAQSKRMKERGKNKDE